MREVHGEWRAGGHLVQVGEALQAADARLANVQHLQVGVQGGREVERLVAGVEDAQLRAQRLPVYAHGVHRLEGMGPASPHRGRGAKGCTGRQVLASSVCMPLGLGAGRGHRRAGQ